MKTKNRIEGFYQISNRIEYVEPLTYEEGFEIGYDAGMKERYVRAAIFATITFGVGVLVGQWIG